jgi:cobalt-zinc-cadmium efflux system membrane fusion protein
LSRSLARLLVGSLCLLALAAAAYYWWTQIRSSPPPQQAAVPTPAHARPAPNAGEVCLPPDSTRFLDLKVERAQTKEVELGVTSVGKVVEDQSRSAHLRSLIPGTISQVLFNLGDTVRKGQVLFYLASVEVGRAKSDYLKARFDLDLAQANLERQRRLFEAKVAARRNLQEAEYTYQTAQANLAAAHRALHLFGLSDSEIEALNHNTPFPHELAPIIPIHAPISGTVVERQVHLGERVGPEDELCRIVDLSSVCIDAHVFEKDLPQIRVGQKVVVTLPAYPQQRFTGRVKYIGDLLEKETGTYIVRTLVPNPEHKLKPGMSASILILTSSRRALVVPREAILEEGSERFVFLKKERSFCKQKVEVGLTTNGLTEVCSGLKEGEEVVVKGNFLLKSELAKGSLEEQRGH